MKVKFLEKVRREETPLFQEGRKTQKSIPISQRSLIIHSYQKFKGTLNLILDIGTIIISFIMERI